MAIFDIAILYYYNFNRYGYNIKSFNFVISIEIM